MSKVTVVISSLISCLCFSSLVFAESTLPPACVGHASKGGAGGGNGGLSEEIAFREILLKVDRFLQTKTGLDAFPEVNADHFHTVASRARVFMKDVSTEADEVRDNLGNVRTCTWNAGNCSITCSRPRYALTLSGSLAALPGVDASYAVPFVLGAHEVLGMLGVEKGSIEAPSGDMISSRIAQFVREVMTHDLAAVSSKELRSLAESGFYCDDRALKPSFRGKRKSRKLIVDRSGNATLWSVGEPLKAHEYLQVQYAPNDPDAISELKRNLMVKLGISVQAKRLATGKFLGGDKRLHFARNGNWIRPQVFLYSVSSEKDQFHIEFDEDLDTKIELDTMFRARYVTTATLYVTRNWRRKQNSEKEELAVLHCAPGSNLGNGMGVNAKVRDGEIEYESIDD